MKKLFLSALMAVTMQGFAQESAFLFENGSLVDELDNTNSLVPSLAGALPVPDRYGNANDAVEIDNSVVLTATKSLSTGAADYSISCWVKTTNTDAVQRVIVKQTGGNVGGQGSYGYRIYTVNGDLYAQATWVGYRFVFGGGNYYESITSTLQDQNIADGDWHHVVFRIDPGSTTSSDMVLRYELWVDNVLAANEQRTIYPGGFPGSPGSNTRYFTVPDQVPLQVGDSFAINNIGSLVGSIDDIRLFESTLSTSQINSLFLRPPRRIYVDKTATGNNDGTDWANAFNELSDAMQEVVPRDTFWVAQGTYKPHASDREASFEIPENNVAIYGGFNGTETQLSQRDWHTNQTIISGDLQGNDNGNVAYNESTRSDNTHRLFVVRGNGVLVDGLTIESGHANLTNNNTYNRGAAVYKSNDVSDFKIKNSTIRYNVANREGTLYLPFTNGTTNNSLLVESCDFYGNFGRYAAGFNSATNVTGAVTEVEVYNSRFFDNEAGDVSSGDGLSGSCFTLFANQGTINATLVNNTFAYNQNNGNNMALLDAAPVVMRRLDNAASDVINLELHNNIFWGNTVNGNVPNPAVAIGLANRQSNNITSVNVSNNVIDYGTLANRSVSITPVGPYNADTDPDFADGPNGNLRLTASSWVLDLGDNSKLPASITKDVEGGDRVLNTTIDFGAHEYNPNLCNPPVAINTQPSDETVCPGDNVTLSAAAAGNNVTYQWQLDGVDISGATSSSLTINGVAQGDVGDYTVVASDACNDVTSSVATVDLNTATSITTQPAAATACAGTNTSFSVSANGSNLSYQWKLDGTNLSGETSATLDVNGVSAGDAGNYTVEVSGDCGTETSNVAALTINPLTSITSQPSSETLCAGDDASFSVSANGSNLSYQWKLDGTNLSGETSATLNVNGVSTGDAGSYTVEVSGDCGTETSNVAALTVNPLTAITSQPSSETLCAGGNASFSVSANGSNLSYQWKLDGTNLSGETSATLDVNGVSAGDAGNYTVEVSGDCGTETSNVAALTVNPLTAITSQPSSETLCAGDDASFSVSANGSNLSYQWKLDGTNLSGETSATLNLTGVDAVDAGNYTVEVSGDCGTETSSVASLTVNEVTAITAQPSDETLCAGDDATLSVTATGDNLSYQWVLGSLDISGETTSELELTNVGGNDAGSYTVEVTGTCGTVTSDAAAVQVFSNTAITQQPSDITACEGTGTNSFQVIATGTNVDYQWYQDGLALSGETSSVLNLGGAELSEAGIYTVDVIGACGTVTSDAATLTVNEETVITVQPNGVNLCEGSPVTIEVQADGSNLTYQWSQDGNVLSGETQSTLSIASLSAAEVGDYTVAVTGDCGTVTSNVADVLMIIAPAITAQPIDVTACEGESVTLSADYDGQWFDINWLLDGNVIASAGDPNVTTGPNAPGGSGTFELELTDVEVADAGDYTLEITGYCIGHDQVSDAATLTVNELPEPTITENMGMLETGAGFDTYQWYLDGVALTGETSATTAVGAPGDYTVEVTLNGCTGESDPYTPMTVGIRENERSITRLYPNPVVNEVNIELAGFSGQVEVSVVDVTGRVVYLSNEGGTLVRLDLSQLTAGAYSLVVRGQNGETAVRRMIKN